MATQPVVDSEIIRPSEIRSMRDQVGAMVAVRIAGVQPRALDGFYMPQWTKDIVAGVVHHFNHHHPEGLPPPPASIEIAADYARRARLEFDRQVAERFTLSDKF